MAQIFLCHASADSAQVEEIYRRLQGLGFQPWMETLDLLPGQQWQQDIPKALKDSDVVLIFLSRQSMSKRNAVQGAFQLALDTLDEIPEGAIPTVLVRLDDCDIPELFADLLRADVFAEEGFEQMIKALRREVSLRQQRVRPQTFRNSLGMVFVLMPAGTFTMGSNVHVADLDEQPVHQVTITQPYDLGKYAVTQGQWETVMGGNCSAFPGDPNLPVAQVSWHDVQTFILKLNEREHGKTYRLPTEAEWEYACRAGTTTAYSFGDDPSQLDEYAWYWDNSDFEPHPVGQLKPNPWGLHDMHGNIAEWVQDWYGEYPAESITDPMGPSGGSLRTLRGGSWYDEADSCRSASRSYAAPDDRYHNVGFRLLREVP